LLDVYQQAIMGPRLQHLYHLIERARGEIRREVSNEVAAAMMAGPLFYHLVLIQPLGGHEPAQLLEHLADAALYGIAASSPAGSRPALCHFEQSSALIFQRYFAPQKA